MSVIGSNILAGAAGQGGGYTIERSLRLRSSASAYLDRTPTAVTNNLKWTWSAWVKRGALANQGLFDGYYNNSNFTTFSFYNNGFLFYNYGGSELANITTAAVFRDPSAWYHIVLVYDSANATSADRLIIYVNGVRQTLTTSTAVVLNSASWVNNTSSSQRIGIRSDVPWYFDGYVAETNFIDGQALTPSSFGGYNEDTGVWQPAKYAGSYGTNGFYLPFSDNTTTTTLAEDASGNGNDWTPNNISLTSGATYDSMTDTPTPYADGGNYCTFNPLEKNSFTTQAAPLDGNMRLYGTGGRKTNFGITSGKWYAEFTLSGGGTPSSNFPAIGIREAADNGYWCGYASNSVGYQQGGTIYYDGNTVAQATGVTYTTGDVLSIAYDADTGKVWFAKNGTWIGTGSPDPATGTSPPYTFSGTSTRFMAGDSIDTSYGGLAFNAGQRPFAYTPPTGFLPLHTGNLPDSAIVDGSEYFNAVTFSGDGSAGSVTGVGFQPDFIWAKNRTNAYSNEFWDVIRGVNSELQSNTTGAEITDPNRLVSFDSDGFSYGTSSNLYVSGTNSVAWNWKANGAGVSNTDGSITSTVSANPTSGFSIVTYTGTGAVATVGHGLGVAPAMVIVKTRESTNTWRVGHDGLTSWAYQLRLDDTAGQALNNGIFNSTAPTSTVFTVGSSVTTNQSTKGMVAYCFSEVAGYSKFGSYTGNGSANGPFVFTGFRPAFVLVKRTNSTGSWVVLDDARDSYNEADAFLLADSSQAESTATTLKTDFLSNGFKQRQTGAATNASGGTYIYMAFAENPFKNSLAR